LAVYDSGPPSVSRCEPHNPRCASLVATSTAIAARRSVKAAAAGVLIALVAASTVACGRSRNDYELNVDLGPAIRSLGSDDLEVSEPAADKIVALGLDTIPVLRTALEREPPAVRLGVVEILERLDDPAARAILVDIARRDKDTEVRGMAIRTLGPGAGAEARAVVEAALSDPEVDIRLAAAGACAALCVSSSALDRLVVLAIEDQPLSNGIAARAALLRILAGGDQARAERVREAIRVRVPTARNGDAPLRAAILASDVGDVSGRAILAGAVRGDGPPMLRLQAIHALGKVGTEAEVPVLAALDGQPAFGPYAYDALRHLADRGVAGAQPALDAWRGPAPPGELPPPGAG